MWRVARGSSAISGAMTSSWSCPSAAAALAADTIVTRFDQAAPSYYDDTDLQRGWIEVLNRRGEPQRYEAIAVSIGVASTQRTHVRAFRRGDGRRHRDEELHEDDARVFVGDRPPDHLT